MKFTAYRDLYQAKYQNLSLRGISMAGICTHISIPELKLCVDVGYSHPSILGHRNYLVTHSHMDHASGIPYIISNKALTNQNTPNFFMPESMIEPMTNIMQIWSDMEGHQYKYKFIPTELRQLVDLGGNYGFKAFPTFHRVDSNGYTIIQTKKKLKEKYLGLPATKVQSLKESGVEIENKLEIPLISVTGDTKIDFLDATEEVRNSRVLVLEVTYADSRKSIESTREWGHIHLDELIPRLGDIKSEYIILKHFSRRHSYNEVLDILENRLPESEKDRVVVLPW
ncbi:MAG: MBL fold metallo-hydrolase [Bdellovibrionales bacterium]